MNDIDSSTIMEERFMTIVFWRTAMTIEQMMSTRRVTTVRIMLVIRGVTKVVSYPALEVVMM